MGLQRVQVTEARPLICFAGSQLSDVCHRQYTFNTTHLNAPCGRCPIPMGVWRKFIPLPRELQFAVPFPLIPQDFSKFQSRSCGKSCGTFPLPCKTNVNLDVNCKPIAVVVCGCISEMVQIGTWLLRNANRNSNVLFQHFVSPFISS